MPCAALRGRRRVRRCRQGVVGWLERRGNRGRHGDRPLPRSGARPPAASRWPVFQVKGPLNIARCPQGHPVIINAAARRPTSIGGAHRRRRVLGRAGTGKRPTGLCRSEGPSRHIRRAPDQLAVLPGVMPIIGRTDAEAKDKLALLQSWLTPTNALTLVSGRLG